VEKKLTVHLTCIDDIDRSGTSMFTNSKGLILIHLIKKEKKKKPAVHLTCNGDINRSGTSVLTNSKGLVLIHLIKRAKKKSHPPDRH
jgi:hypothetical protein